MGMYDTVSLECPDCGHVDEHQTKWGPCRLGEYDIHNAPLDAMEDFVQNPVYCSSCGCEYKVFVVRRPEYKVIKSKKDVDSDFY